MKRFQGIISLLLACVLVIGIVPVTAVAEESMPDATVPETTTVEITVPETTEIFAESSGKQPLEDPVVPQEETKTTEDIIVPKESPAAVETVEDAFREANYGIVASGTCGDNLIWELTEQGALTISGEGEMTEFLNSSDRPWNDYVSRITTVEIEDGVTSVGSTAFASCVNLRSAVIADSVATLGNHVFYWCKLLSSVKLPERLDAIPNYLFYSCSSLITVTIPDNVTTIEHDAFSSCTALQGVDLPVGLKTIDEWAFSSCTSLEKINIPEGVETIGERAFSYCDKLTEVILPDSITTLGHSAFSDCNELEKVKLSMNLVQIKGSTFSSCGALEEITIPSSVTTIWDSAFSRCSSLKKITFAGKAPWIYEDAFESVRAAAYYPKNYVSWTDDKLLNYGGDLTWITYDNGSFEEEESLPSDAVLGSGKVGETVNWKLTADGTLTIGGEGKMADFVWLSDRPWDDYVSYITSVVIEEGVTYVSACPFSNCFNLKSAVIADSVTTMRGSVFSGCTLLSSVKLPAGLAEIPSYLFEYCRGLTTVTIPDTVNIIDSGAFFECAALQHVKLPNGLKTIESEAFQECFALQEIEIPSSVTAIGENAFSNCTSLKKITFAGKAPSIAENTFVGVRAEAYYPGNDISWAQETLQNYGGTLTWIPYSEKHVHKFGDDGKCDCGAIGGTCGDDLIWTLDDEGVLTIFGSGKMTDYSNEEHSPWYFCKERVLSVLIESGVTTIGDWSLEGCVNMESVIIPEGITSIGESVFWNCNSLSSVTIPASVTSVGEDPFASCTSLSGIWVKEGNPNYSSDAYGALFNKDKSTLIRVPATMEQYHIPYGVTHIEDRAFNLCEEMTSVTIPDSVTTIDDYAFWTCGLTSVEIPASVTTIGNHSLCGCRALTGIWVDSNNPNYSNDEFGVLFNKNKKQLIQAPGAIEQYIIPDSVNTIGAYAFGYCFDLDSITIPDSVTSIGELAFYDCRGLTSITIPKGVTVIAGHTFYGCDNLINVSIPDSAISIDGCAFMECDSLTEITIPGSIKAINYVAFGYCDNLTSVIFKGHAPTIASDAFCDVTSTAYYPEYNETWNEDTMQQYGGIITWVAYDPCKDGHMEVMDAAVASSCTATGLTEGVHCSVCGEVLTAQQIVPATGHMEVIDAAVAPTCTTTGLTEGKHCAACGEVITAQQTVPATGHTEVVDDAVAPSCNATGLTEGKHCSVCGEVITAQQTVPATGHTEVIDDAVAPTCTATGLTEGKHCQVCKIVILKQEVVPALGCSFTNYVSNEDATCIADGTKTALCDRECGASDTIVEEGSLNPDAHSFGKWVIQENKQERVCSLCGYTESKVSTDGGDVEIEAPEQPDLDFDVDHVEPTDEQYILVEEALGGMEGTDQEILKVFDINLNNKDGVHVQPNGTVKVKLPLDWEKEGNYKVYRVNEDGTLTDMEAYQQGSHMVFETDHFSLYVIVEETVHVHEYRTETTPPTCTEKGYTTYTCECGHTYIADKVPALGHREAVDAAVAATCTETGLTEGKHCSVCNTVLIERNVVPALGHTEVIDSAVPATCIRMGLTEGSHCSVCNTVLVEQKDTPLAEHTWNEGVITTEPTENEPGVMTYTCTVCGETRTEEIPCLESALPSVQRVAGTSRADTALEVADALKEALGVEKFDTIILANGEDKNFADALTGSYLATVRKAPILMYRTSGLSPATKAYIQNNLVSGGTVYLLGGELAIPTDVETELSAAGYEVLRLAGGSRFDTNLAILEEAGVGGKEILIARGFEFADSLSASATGLPILMVNEVTGKLTDSQISFLKGLKGNKLTILGGTVAISEALQATIEGVVGREVDRVAGGSREATSVEIAKRYFDAPDFAVAAYSRRCPDGLCGGPLAYAMGAPLLLVNEGQERYANAYITEKEITSGYVLGGTLVITDKTARAVFGLADDAVIEMK